MTVKRAPDDRLAIASDKATVARKRPQLPAANGSVSRIDGDAGVGIFATDAGSPAVQGYAYGTAGYGPTGGFIVLKSDTPKGGKRSLVIPLVW